MALEDGREEAGSAQIAVGDQLTVHERPGVVDAPGIQPRHEGAQQDLQENQSQQRKGDSGQASAAQRRRLLPILEVPKRRPVMMFIAVWVVINVAFGLAGPLATGTMSANIAWQAHLGGFFAGLLLIGVIEKPPLSPSGGPGNVDYGDWKDRA